MNKKYLMPRDVYASEEHQMLKEKLRLRFIGNVDQSIFDSLDQLDLSNNYERL